MNPGPTWKTYLERNARLNFTRRLSVVSGGGETSKSPRPAMMYAARVHFASSLSKNGVRSRRPAIRIRKIGFRSHFRVSRNHRNVCSERRIEPLGGKYNGAEIKGVAAINKSFRVATHTYSQRMGGSSGDGRCGGLLDLCFLRLSRRFALLRSGAGDVMDVWKCGCDSGVDLKQFDPGVIKILIK